MNDSTLKCNRLIVDISPEGWQIVAGGCSEAKTTGTNRKELHPEGGARLSHLAPRRGAVIPACLTGGLRFAATTGYFLATRWVASLYFEVEFA